MVTPKAFGAAAQRTGLYVRRRTTAATRCASRRPRREIDVMEASSHTFLSTFHGDLVGASAERTRSADRTRLRTREPSARHLDTRRPFRVAATFEADGNRSTLRRIADARKSASRRSSRQARTGVRLARATIGERRRCVISYWAAATSLCSTACARGGEQDAWLTSPRVLRRRRYPPRLFGGAAGCTDEARARNGVLFGRAAGCRAATTRRGMLGRCFRPGSEWASGEGFRPRRRAARAEDFLYGRLAARATVQRAARREPGVTQLAR